MNLLIVGINHNSAPVELREKVAFTPEQMPNALDSIVERAGLNETAILSTCNRTEVIAVSDNSNAAAVVGWLADYHKLGQADLDESIYIKEGQEAVHHALRVASGLDSMVVGETQILGQFKECFDTARRIGSLGPELDHLAQTAFRIAKRVRTETAIGESSVSVASTAVTLASQLFTDLGNCNVLLIGAGDTSRLVGEHMHAAGVRNIVIANRTLDNAVTLANQFGGEAIDLQSLSLRLPEADIVVASTAAQLPILGKGMAERALKSRKHKPILMVDLAVPRDIEPEVAELRDIYLYSVDDLQAIIESNLSSRAEAASEAEDILGNEVAGFRTKQETKKANQVMAQFRETHDEIKQRELDKALSRLQKGDAAEEVMTTLANQLMNKIIHPPSVAIRQATDADDTEALEMIRKLFDLDRQDT